MNKINLLENNLSSYACHSSQSKGRFFTARTTETRNDFQRDRDRIIHSRAFRRLAHKTQVFVYYEGDHYRNRLTHSLEVAQIARAIARRMGLQEDLTETIALAHDLGHPPFGHAGEEALNLCMKDYGGFDHNGQSLKIVTILEQRYPNHDGLNLTWESLEGIAKHNGPLISQKDDFSRLCREIKAVPFFEKLDLHGFASLEAQIAALSDDIAYHAHDIDDGLRAGLITLEQLVDTSPLLKELIFEIKKEYSHLTMQNGLRYELIRRFMTCMVEDLIQETQKNIINKGVQTVDDIRELKKPLVIFSDEMNKQNKIIKSFLFENMYFHPKVNLTTSKAKRIVTALFNIYMEEPQILLEFWKKNADKMDKNERAVLISDFIAGMTDKFAIEEYKRLFYLTTGDI